MNKKKDRKDAVDISTKEFENIQFQKACSYGAHLSNVFYLTLGFFVAISGWFITNEKIDYSIGGYIGLLFLLLLLNIAKVSRLHSDNQKVIEDFDKKYGKGKIRFELTALEGVGDFIHYLILVSITTFFLLYPFDYSMPSTKHIAILVFVVLMGLIYIVLAGGHFCIGRKNRIKSERIQKYITYSLLIFALLYFLQLSSMQYLWGGFVMDNYIIGLFISILGVFLLGYFGLPTTYLENINIVKWGYNKDQRIMRQVFSWLGIMLTILGFMIQVKFR